MCHLKELSSKKRKGKKKSDKLLRCPVGVLSIDYSGFSCVAPGFALVDELTLNGL